MHLNHSDGYFLQAGFFTATEGVSVWQVVDLGAAYIGYVVLGNLSIKMNTVPIPHHSILPF